MFIQKINLSKSCTDKTSCTLSSGLGYATNLLDTIGKFKKPSSIMLSFLGPHLCYSILICYSRWHNWQRFQRHCYRKLSDDVGIGRISLLDWKTLLCLSSPLLPSAWPIKAGRESVRLTLLEHYLTNFFPSNFFNEHYFWFGI